MRTIKFDHAASGQLEIGGNYSTSLADVFAIGAVTLTAKSSWEGREKNIHYATDQEGLESISSRAEQTVNFLHHAVQGIGVLLAHADHKEIEHEMNSIAWLIVGLGELAEMTTDARSEIDYWLKDSK